jgi:hypothetical protein
MKVESWGDAKALQLSFYKNFLFTFAAKLL